MPFTLLHSAAQCARLESSKSLCSHVNGACASVLFHRTILSPPWPLASLQNSNQSIWTSYTSLSLPFLFCHIFQKCYDFPFTDKFLCTYNSKGFFLLQLIHFYGYVNYTVDTVNVIFHCIF